MPNVLNPNATPSMPLTITVPADGDAGNASDVEAPLQDLLDGLHSLTAGDQSVYVEVYSGMLTVADDGTFKKQFDVNTDDTNYASLTFTKLADLGNLGIDTLKNDILELTFSGYVVYEEVQGGNAWVRLQVYDDVGNALAGPWGNAMEPNIVPQVGENHDPTSSATKANTTLVARYTYGGDTLQANADVRLVGANIASGGIVGFGTLLCRWRLLRARV